jgi:hypothetical protein
MRIEDTRPAGHRSRIGHAVAGAIVVAVLVAAAALSSGSARAVVQAVPANTAEPAISGSAAVGSTLNATPGSWNGTTPIAYAYQWVRCPTSGGKSDGSDCATISGATASSYTVVAADAGKRLRVRVTASNADGSHTVASNATATVPTSGTGLPRNTKAPAITGTLSTGGSVHADPGSWNGAQPITYTFRWLRCDTGGNNCLELSGQTDDSYTLRDGDIGHTLRVRVTARNGQGSRSKLSATTAAVAAGSGLPAGAVKLSNGETSIPATSVTGSERLVVDRVDFSPNPVRTRTSPITIHIKVKDTRGYDVRDVLVFIRSTPLVTSVPAEQRTADDGTVTYTVQPESDFPVRNGYAVQFFVKAHRQGDNPLGGIAGYRLVQVPTAR